MQIVPYATRHFSGVENLWERCFPDDPPRNRARAAIPAKLAMADDLLLVAETKDGQVIGTVMAGYDGHRGWLYAVAVAPEMRRHGVGRALIEDASSRLQALGCVKVNLQIRASNRTVQAFYRALGFAIEDRLSMGRELQPNGEG